MPDQEECQGSRVSLDLKEADDKKNAQNRRGRTIPSRWKFVAGPFDKVVGAFEGALDCPADEAIGTSRWKSVGAALVGTMEGA